MKSKHTVLFLITAFTLATISTLIGCDKQLLIMKMDDMKEPEKESTQIHGIGESKQGDLYTFGTIIIQYDAEIWRKQAQKKYTPITTVNDFLVSKGYTPKVRSILPGSFTEIIDIDKSIRPLPPLIWPLVEELQTIPGVVSAQQSVVRPLRLSPIHGTIIIQYDEETWKQAYKKYTPITTVNDFLVGKGYTPKVRGILPGSFTEVIEIDKNIDSLPLVEELQTVPGVVWAQQNTLLEYVDFLARAKWRATWDLPAPSIDKPVITANKVGKTADGRLFELGVLLVTYEESISLEMESAPVAAVLRSLSDKGYKPIVKDVFYVSDTRNTQVIDIGQNINPLPSSVEYIAIFDITGVYDVELNTLYEFADLLLGKITVVSLFDLRSRY